MNFTKIETHLLRIGMSLTLFSSMCINACGQMTYDEKLNSLYKKTVPLIQSPKLKKVKKETDDIVILDIRSKKEFDISHLQGAKFIDYDSFKLDDVAGISKNTKVIVYCSVGYRSERVGEKMIAAGYEDVSNLYGGIFQWVNEENMVVQQQGTPTDSVHTYNKKWSKWLKKGIKVYE